jgi:hypothetical protein
MDDDKRAWVRVVATYYVLLGGLCLIVGAALLLYNYLNPEPYQPPHFVGVDMSRWWLGCVPGLFIFGAVLVGAVVLSAVLDRRRK